MSRATAAAQLDTDMSTLVTDLQSYIDANQGNPKAAALFVISRLRMAHDRLARILVTDGARIVSSPVDTRTMASMDHDN
jgi:hypothetical protein